MVTTRFAGSSTLRWPRHRLSPHVRAFAQLTEWAAIVRMHQIQQPAPTEIGEAGRDSVVPPLNNWIQ
jgi:hypothetical protein